MRGLIVRRAAPLHHLSYRHIAIALTLRTLLRGAYFKRYRQQYTKLQVLQIATSVKCMTTYRRYFLLKIQQRLRQRLAATVRYSCPSSINQNIWVRHNIANRLFKDSNNNLYKTRHVNNMNLMSQVRWLLVVSFVLIRDNKALQVTLMI